MSYIHSRTLYRLVPVAPVHAVITGDASVTASVTAHRHYVTVTMNSGSPTVTLLYTLPLFYLPGLAQFGSYLHSLTYNYRLDANVTGVLTASLLRLSLPADGTLMTAEVHAADNTLPTTAGVYQKALTPASPTWQGVYQFHFTASVDALSSILFTYIRANYAFRI